MRRITTTGVATVGLTSFLVVGAGIGSAYADPGTPSPADTPATAGSTVAATPAAEPTTPTVDVAESDTPPAPETPGSAAVVPDPTASTGQAVAPRRQADEVKTVAQVAAGRAILALGDTGPAVNAIQVRLNAAGIKVAETGIFDKATAAAVRHLQWKYLLDEDGKVDRGTYRRLLSITKGRLVLPKTCRNPKTKLIICIDLKQRVLRYVKRGKVAWTIDIRSGMPSTPTRRGTWHVFSKQTYVISSLYHTPMPYSMFFSGGQALHYSMFFDAVGYNGASHGCVNIGSMSQARWLYHHTPMGTTVRVY